MKLTVTIVTLLMSFGAFAQDDSTYVGAWMQYSIGQQGADAQWAYCLFTPGQIVIKNGAGELTSRPVATPDNLVAKLTAAKEEPYGQTGTVWRTLNPPHRIEAGIAPELRLFPLQIMHTHIDGRSGVNSEELIAFMEQECAGLEAK